MSLPFSPQSAPPPAGAPLLVTAGRKRRRGALTVLVFALVFLVAPLVYLVSADRGHRDHERLEGMIVEVRGEGKDRRVVVELPDSIDEVASATGSPGEQLTVWRKNSTKELFASQPAITWWEWAISAALALIGVWMVVHAVRSWQLGGLLPRVSLGDVRGVLGLRTLGLRHQTAGNETLTSVDLEVTHSTMGDTPPGTRLTLSAEPDQLPDVGQLQGQLEAWALDDGAGAPLIVHAVGSPQWWTGARASLSGQQTSSS